MGEFLHMFSHSNNKDIVLHIIKSFALLILTLTDKRSIYYLFSHNCFKQILNSHFEDYGDDFLSYYVNFIKSLTLKIDLTNITFFFDPKTNKFPLLESTLRLYNYPDPMIQNVVKTIFLTCLRLNHELIYKYLCSLPSVTYFPFIACRLRDLTVTLNAIIIKENLSSDDEELLFNTKCVLDDMLDEVLYLQDIFSLKIIKINHILINCLFYYWILPSLYHGLLNKGDIAFNLALYILSLLFFYIKDEEMINMLFIVFFYPKMNSSLLKLIEHKADPPQNYHFDWTLQLKEYHESTFQSHILFHYSKEYIRSLIKKPYLPYMQITPIVEKYEVHPLYHKKTLEEQYNYIIEDVFKFFNENDLKEMAIYHTNISKATGVHVGIDDENNNNTEQYSIISIMKRLIENSTKDKGIEDKFISNEVKNNIFKTFHSKEFPQSFIGNILLHIILDSKIISEDLFEYSSFITLQTSSCQITINNHLNNNSTINHSNSIDCSLSCLFDNNYFKTILKDKASAHQNDNQSPNSELLRNLLNHFITQNYLHSRSNLVIISNVLGVHSHIKAQSELVILSPQDQDIINRTYYIFLSNIKLTLKSNEDIKQKAYSIFESTWLNHSKGLGEKIKNQLTLPDLLLPQPKMPKITDLELFKGILSIFIALYNMRIVTLELSSDLLLNKFPLGNANFEYSTGDKINLLDSLIESFECMFKKQGSQSFNRIVLVLYLNYMFICKLDTDDEYSAIIEEKYPLRQISSLKDYSNKRELFIDVKDDRGAAIDKMKIQLNDEMFCTRAYDKIEEYVAYAKTNESQMFENYILKLINEWELIK